MEKGKRGKREGKEWREFTMKLRGLVCSPWLSMDQERNESIQTCIVTYEAVSCRHRSIMMIDEGGTWGLFLFRLVVQGQVSWKGKV